jgi:putative Mn2+ efflux pump MntP
MGAGKGFPPLARPLTRAYRGRVTPSTIAVIALSMSADACAAAIGRGAAYRPSLGAALRTGLVFGAVETVTPLIGWALGLAAASHVQAVDHWIAFVLLSLVGAKMALEGLTREGEDAPRPGRGTVALVLTAIGTSVDAAAVGVTLAVLNVPILAVAAAIGAATFTFATLGLLLGRAVGARFGAWVEVAGGLALIALGLKILAEHTGLVG